MNPTSSNLLTYSRMVSRLSGVYLLSFCLIGLNVGSMPNLCSITSLEIPGINDICHVKTSRFSRRKVTTTSSYLTSSSVLIQSFLSASLRSTEISLSMPPFFSSVAGWFDVEATNVPFFAVGGRGVLPTADLGVVVLAGVLPPCVLAILAAKSCASFLLHFSACECCILTC
jgi:hypothetical protein